MSCVLASRLENCAPFKKEIPCDFIIDRGLGANADIRGSISAYSSALQPQVSGLSSYHLLVCLHRECHTAREGPSAGSVSASDGCLSLNRPRAAAVELPGVFPPGMRRGVS